MTAPLKIGIAGLGTVGLSVVRVLRETADRRMAFEFAIGVPGLEPQYALLDASRQRTN